MLPVTIIGGYLGAGKTTLVNAMLRQAAGVRLAVLVNEFGALPIDADLIEAQDDDLISIAGGCICCSYGNDLIQAVTDLAALDPAPDHVLIEASGVALPGAIGATVSLLADVSLDGIVVLADAETAPIQLRDVYMGDTVARQLADADIVVLNKIDLAGDLAGVRDVLAQAAPKAAVVEATHGQVPNAVLLQDFAPDPSTLSTRTDHQAGFDSAYFDVGEMDAAWLAAALADPDLSLVRAKGFVPTKEGLRTVHVVGRRHAVSAAPDGATPGIVAIAPKGLLDRDRIAALFG